MSSPGLSLCLPVHNLADRVDRHLGEWSKALGEGELILVDDGSTDGTAERAERAGGATVLRHDTKRGFGACVRTALAVAKYPVFGYVGSDYPYSPSDLKKLLAVIGTHNEEMNLPVDVASGCRTGIALPGFWKSLGTLQRLFYRVALGNPQEPLAGWLGLGEHLYNGRTSWIYGNPFHDVNCAFKLFTKARLDTIPIQCDDDGVHTELVAKLTFLTTLMAEVPLTPKPDAIPATVRRGMGTVWHRPQFRVEKTEIATDQIGLNG